MLQTYKHCCNPTTLSHTSSSACMCVTMYLSYVEGMHTLTCQHAAGHSTNTHTHTPPHAAMPLTPQLLHTSVADELVKVVVQDLAAKEQVCGQFHRRKLHHSRAGQGTHMAQINIHSSTHPLPHTSLMLRWLHSTPHYTAPLPQYVTHCATTPPCGTPPCPADPPH